MAGKKVTVVISQAQGKNPAKRHLEEELAATLLLEPNVEVSIIPHLYDLPADHTGMLFLRGVPGDMIICSWLFTRAARWVLDRQQIRGLEGKTLLKSAEDENEEGEPEGESAAASSNRRRKPAAEASQPAPETAGESNPKAIGSLNVPNRRIYCLDLRDHADPQVYLDEIRRIVREVTTPVVGLLSWIQGQPKPEQLQRYLHPQSSPAQPAGDSARSAISPASNGSANGQGNGQGNGHTSGSSVGTLSLAALLSPQGLRGSDSLTPAASSTNGAADTPHDNGQPSPVNFVGTEAPKRRWYPVIDYSRCTNCMECIDFCLFGVYGVDNLDRILVEQQDNCKKGCPACSRVCPENAIIFPEHKTPAIAGADNGAVGNLKIDLSKLFGAPTALEQAVAERDVELVNDGREAVGMSVGLPKRQTCKPTQPRDALDDLMDGLDQLG